MHHALTRCNYGPYTVFWDRLHGTYMPFQVKSSKRTDKSFNEVCRIVPLGIQDHHQHMHQESNEVTSDDKYEGGMLLFQVSNQTSVIRLEGDVPL